MPNEEDRDVTKFLFSNDPSDESRLPSVYRFARVLFGISNSPFLLSATIKHHLKKYSEKYTDTGIEWDESLPDDIIPLWADWCEEVPKLTDFSIPRCYFSDPLVNNFKTLEIHLFSDASTKTYGTVAYLCVTSSNKEILTSFVVSKNRIAPLKTSTLPRLELMGALLSARLSSNILKALKLDIPFFFWTDSKITYFWVRGQPERFKPFIKNRIQEIQKLTSPSNWHHCPGIQNQADIVSRGVKISRLLNDTSWLQGPEWLRLPPEFWPESKNEDSPNSPDLEYRKSNDIVLHECIIEK
ncbi:integrase catalytic domain-containing protein [Trichonephila clavipes]|nr:integrase catalytic domain-containing protein [Trichonephila clavipes]